VKLAGGESLPSEWGKNKERKEAKPWIDYWDLTHSCFSIHL